MKVINVIGAPGVGKSSISAQVFAKLKSLHINCELVCEYAKDLVWQNRRDMLGTIEGQYHIFAEQLHRLARLQNFNLEFVVTDSPLIQGIVYMKNSPVKPDFENIVKYEFSKFENLSFFLKRNRELDFQAVGRIHDAEESDRIEEEMINVLTKNNIEFVEISHDNFMNVILDSVVYEIHPKLKY